jgi:hypothetical protein
MTVATRTSITSVVVTLPPTPQATMPQQGHHWGGHYFPVTPGVYWGAPETKNHEGCFGAIVEGGALEVRRHFSDGSFDYEVVTGYAPGAWSIFTNVGAEDDDEVDGG